MKIKSAFTALCLALLVAGCASAPTGPTVMALPGTGKNFEQFRADDSVCRHFAENQTASAASNQSDVGVRNAAIGTAIGVVAGAAIGGRDGAAVGAGTGLLVGSASGSEASYGSAYGTQRQYDNAYVQCMYSKGQRVPVSASLANSRSQAPVETAPPPPAGNYLPPPPPPGSAPR